ncbi:MAG: DUF1292 domain-containing protein [Oscillospiraceae bacterium]|jgi:uncharacterized protein YrzB (UPF0473 family)|nr:DUF1292 domain-containing protein [Oscillospiraceae bacterium]
MPHPNEYKALAGDAQRGALGEIELIDEEGNARRFGHLLTLEHNNASYLALTADPEVNSPDSDEISVGFLRIVPQPDGSDVYKDDVPEPVVEELFAKLNELMDEPDDE